MLNATWDRVVYLQSRSSKRRVWRIMGNYRACAVLLGRGTVFRLKRLLGRPMWPRSITIKVTRRRNSHCIMCNIWRLKRTQEELTLKAMVRFFLVRSLTGPQETSRARPRLICSFRQREQRPLGVRGVLTSAGGAWNRAAFDSARRQRGTDS